MDISGVILTAALSVGALFLITKLMGHKQVAELDFFDYVSGITIGSIGAELATELESPEEPLVALGVWGLASVLLSLLSHKLPKTRKYINGTPTILINAGKIYRENLKTESAPRCVCDYLSGMTDRFAIELYRELFIPEVWRVK